MYCYCHCYYDDYYDYEFMIMVIVVAAAAANQWQIQGNLGVRIDRKLWVRHHPLYVLDLESPRC